MYTRLKPHTSMKHFLLVLLFMCAFSASAQKTTDSTYVSNTGTTFKVGQTITLGLGSGTDGQYKYIVGFDVFGLPEINDRLNSSYATQKVIITKIKHVKASMFSKKSTAYLLFKIETAIMPYGINIEPALLAKEIIITNQ